MQYLNKDLKDDILSNIKLEVVAKINKSVPGKELAALQAKLIRGIYKEYKKICPTKDLLMLKEYKCTRKILFIRLVLAQNDGEDYIREPYFHDPASLKMELTFNPALEICLEHGLFSVLFGESKALTTLGIDTLKIFNDVQCEIEETMNAYTQRVSKYKTVPSLLKAFPTMAKYIPEEVHMDSGRVDRLIDQFENE